MNLPDRKSPFASKHSFGNAYKKSTDSLPNIPPKRLAVVEKLAIQVGLQGINAKDKKIKFGIREDVKKLVVNFYLEANVSRQMPGMKDVISVKQDRVKKIVPKRLLMFNPKETNEQFLKDHEKCSIGFSLICNLGPKQVLLVGSKSQTMCCCPYCENILI